MFFFPSPIVLYEQLWYNSLDKTPNSDAQMQVFQAAGEESEINDDGGSSSSLTCAEENPRRAVTLVLCLECEPHLGCRVLAAVSGGGWILLLEHRCETRVHAYSSAGVQF